jgi:hypothetical protein
MLSSYVALVLIIHFFRVCKCPTIKSILIDNWLSHGASVIASIWLIPKCTNHYHGTQLEMVDLAHSLMLLEVVGLWFPRLTRFYCTTFQTIVATQHLFPSDVVPVQVECLVLP